MKYSLLNNYTINFPRLIRKLAIATSIAGTLIFSGQPGQAINELPEKEINSPSLTKAELLKVVLRKHQKSPLKTSSLDRVLVSEALSLEDLASLEQPQTIKVPKKISTVADTLQEESSSSEATIVIKSNLSRDKTREILEIPALEIAQNPLPKKQPKQIHTISFGETLSGIARKYGVSDRELIQANNISNPDRINVNDELLLPTEESGIKVSALDIEEQQSLQESLPVANNNLYPLRLQPTTIVGDRKLAQVKDDPTSVTNAPESVSSSNDDSDPYISKLRADIIKLRTQYQTQVTNNTTTETSSDTSTELTYSSESEEILATSTPSLTNSDSNSQSPTGKGDTSPMEDDYDEIAKLSALNSTIPELPPLSSPEKYLPNSNSFNGYIWPAKGTFTSGFGWRWGKMHKGIDIAAPIGTPIMAAASGEVIFAGWNSGGYGNLVKLKHTDGSITLYAHNNRIYVRKGQRIKQGQQIAEMGSTGYSTGPHLHFEIRLNGRVSVNPIAYLSKKR